MDNFNKLIPSIYINDKGQHIVILPNGSEIPHLIKTCVIDDASSNNVFGGVVCEATFKVNLVANKEEAVERYK
jgi:hypothetical protein